MTSDPRALERWLDGRTPEAFRNATGGLDGPSRAPAHAGLWLDRAWPWWNGAESDDKPGQRVLFETAVAALRLGATPTPALATYQQVFARWRALLTAPSPGLTRRLVVVEATSRVHLHPSSGDTVTEGSVLLHHTYGVPYLTGSALKGIARRRASGGRFAGHVAETLFGAQRKDEDGERDDVAAWIDILDALWVPEAPRGVSSFSPLAVDIVNPHHSDYYAGKQTEARVTDEPIPVRTLTVRPGARFLLVVEGFEGQSEWVDFVVDRLLVPALRDEGVGAHTVAGYGRLHVVDAPAGGGAAHVTSRAAAWVRATLSWNKGKRELSAALNDSPPATTTLAAVIEAMPQELMAKLLKKPTVPAEVRWEPEGRARRIVAVRMPTPSP